MSSHKQHHTTTDDPWAALNDWPTEEDIQTARDDSVQPSISDSIAPEVEADESIADSSPPDSKTDLVKRRAVEDDEAVVRRNNQYMVDRASAKARIFNLLSQAAFQKAVIRYRESEHQAYLEKQNVTSCGTPPEVRDYVEQIRREHSKVDHFTKAQLMGAYNAVPLKIQDSDEYAV